MEGQIISHLIQDSGEQVKTSLQKRGGYIQALGTWALTKKEEAQSRGKMLSRKLGSNSFVF